MADASLLAWLSSDENPPVRYLTSRDLTRPRPSAATLRKQRQSVLRWPPLQRILELQLPDGGFPDPSRTRTARPTFWALTLMQRCGLDVADEPVARAIAYLSAHHAGRGALSYTTGGSGILPCYAGVVTATLIGLGAYDSDIVQASLSWLVDHQRFDHKATRAGGEETWPYRSPVNFGCWDSVSCYHGVAAAFRAFAAVPATARSSTLRRRLDEAITYLRIHRLYKKSTSERPLFRHMTQSSLIGDYRSDLLDMLQGVADADPSLIGEEWVREAVQEMDALTDDRRVPLVKNYGRALMDPIPLEPVGAASRFLSYQWLHILEVLGAAQARSGVPAPTG